MYDKILPTTGSAVIGAGMFAAGSPVWVALTGFALIAVGTALMRIVPRRTE